MIAMQTGIGYVVLTGVVTKEGSQFVSHCTELGTSSSGDTVEEAFQNLKDAVLAHLNELERTGQRHNLFVESNITTQTRPLVAKPPQVNVLFAFSSPFVPG